MKIHGWLDAFVMLVSMCTFCLFLPSRSISVRFRKNWLNLQMTFLKPRISLNLYCGSGIYLFYICAWLQEVERLEVEKRHLVEVLAAHAPSCAKRARRASSSSSATNGPSGGDGNYYSRGPPPELGPAGYDDFKYSAEQSSLLPDTDSAFLDVPEEVETMKCDDEGKHRRHFKSSCSFSPSGTSQEQQYFLAAKSRCLSYGFQMDNRCVAL